MSSPRSISGMSRGDRSSGASQVNSTSARGSLVSDLDDSETVKLKPDEDQRPVCVSCGIRIDECATSSRKGEPYDSGLLESTTYNF